jgi:pimeloyl-ACP methyl ester carboxylesterase
MTFCRVVLAAAVVAAVAASLRAQNYAPPPSQAPPEATLKAIAERSAKLADAIASLRRRGNPEGLLVEAEIFLKAAHWIVRHDEFYQKDYADWTFDGLDRGLLRATHLSRGEAPWLQETGHAVVRAYRSRVDGSIQPYAATLPADYGKEPRRKWRLDVVLHGRDTNLTEVKFLRQHADDHAAAKGQDFIQLDIYGRGNNAYRWAGENDVLEAVDTFVSAERTLGRVQLLDPDRVVLRGFSMGGAGTWHLGLHHPDRWCVIGPGAGFTTTHGYIKGLPDPLPPYQEACLTIYDAVDYAENAFNVPVVAYAGSEDPQLAAARNIEAKLKPLGIPMTLLVGTGLEHKFPPEWQKKAEEEYAKYLSDPRTAYSGHLHFVTYTLRYPSVSWLEMLSLEQHYRRSLVDATHNESGYKVKTENVRAFRLALPVGATRQPVGIDIDGSPLEARPYLAGNSLQLYFEKQADGWRSVLPEKIYTGHLRHQRKISGLQGPIDDAFTAPFLCVRGTGKPWHEATQKYADGNLQRFRAEWDQYFRGELPVKDDVDVTGDDITNKNLVLFGDPSSNTFIAQVLDGLPLKWTKEQVTLAGASASAADHVPVLIYPSPLTPDRYVVLNSGHTFHAAELQGTNAQLYPRLGDYALLKLAGSNKDPLATEVLMAGLFDDAWQPDLK